MVAPFTPMYIYYRTPWNTIVLHQWQARFITHALFEILMLTLRGLVSNHPRPPFRTCLNASNSLARRRNRRGNTRRVSEPAALAATNDSPAPGTKINYLWIILRIQHKTLPLPASLFCPPYSFFKWPQRVCAHAVHLSWRTKFYFGKVSHRLILPSCRIESF